MYMHHMCVYTYIYVYMCVCIYIYIYIYMYTHILYMCLARAPRGGGRPPDRRQTMRSSKVIYLVDLCVL